MQGKGHILMMPIVSQPKWFPKPGRHRRNKILEKEAQ